MKLTDYIKLSEEQEVTLIGKTILSHAGPNGDRTIFTSEMSGKPWKGNFICYNNKLTTLRGGPSSVSGHFDCSDNHLTSLEGAPTEVGSDLYCSNNDLTSLHDIHKIIKKMHGTFYCYSNDIKSHVLGVLLIEDCLGISISNLFIQSIFDKHLPNYRGFQGVLDCQNELLDHGYDEFARL